MQDTPSDTPPPYACVIFDCDSTLSEIEGIDELAGTRAAEIAALTNRAMSGELPLEEVYGARLDLLQPTREAVDRVAALYASRALPNAAALVAALRSLGKRVAVVSGGLREAVEPFARGLGIDSSEVHAVPAHFHADGSYAGFDEDSPLARSGGKPPIVERIAAPSRPGRTVLIGDGVTDLEAAGAVDRFVAFAGVADRPAVTAHAKHIVRVADLAALVPHLFTPDECDRLAQDSDHAPLIAAARRLT
jgi:phosphoserine phosphatase